MKGNSEDLSQRDTLLSGMEGIVYLLLLGRDASVGELDVASFGRFPTETSRINEVVNNLRNFDNTFLIQSALRIPSVRATGQAVITYTANFDPLFDTLRACEIEFDLVEMTALITDLSSMNGEYPTYLCTQFDLDGPGGILHLTFRTLLAHYFLYLAQVLSVVKFPSFPKITIDRTTVDAIRSRLSDVPIKMADMAVQLLRYNGAMANH